MWVTNKDQSAKNEQTKDHQGSDPDEGDLSSHRGDFGGHDPGSVGRRRGDRMWLSRSTRRRYGIGWWWWCSWSVWRHVNGMSK